MIGIQRISNHGLLSPSWHLYTTNPIPKAQRTLQKKKGCKRQDQDAHCERASLRHDRVSASMKYQQYGCVNKVYTVTTPVTMSTQIRENVTRFDP